MKGSTTATVRVRGVPGDASLADGGRNAFYDLAQLLARLEHREPVTRVAAEVRPLVEFVGPDGDGPLGDIAGSLTRTVLTPAVIEADGPMNVVPSDATLTVYCATVPGTTREDVEGELRAALGENSYELEVDEPQGGLTSPTDTPLADAIRSFLAEHDPEARLVPTLGYGFSDCHVFRAAFGTIAYGFIPFRHADPRVNLATKHGADERVLVDDLLFQVEAARHVARAIGEPSG